MANRNQRVTDEEGGPHSRILLSAASLWIRHGTHRARRNQSKASGASDGASPVCGAVDLAASAGLFDADDAQTDGSELVLSVGSGVAGGVGQDGERRLTRSCPNVARARHADVAAVVQTMEPEPGLLAVGYVALDRHEEDVAVIEVSRGSG
jgi:hypothetical protein